MKNKLKSLSFKHVAKSQPEGDGAIVSRIMPNSKFKNFDPFLMMDFGVSRLPSGFPDHPHRGFETITYVISGTVLHEDFKGNKGKLEPGMVQWMTAGKGIVHAEMPGSFEEDTVLTQLWLNLPAAKKMIEPYYQEYSKEEIITIEDKNYIVKLIAGDFAGKTGAVKTNSAMLYLDAHLQEDAEIEIALESGFRGFILVHDGTVQFDGTSLKYKESGFFEEDEEETVLKLTGGEQGGKVVVIAGKPIGEKVVQYGPFVMNTKEEIEQAFEDYQQGKNGFEGAAEWESKIRNMKYNK